MRAWRRFLPLSGLAHVLVFVTCSVFFEVEVLPPGYSNVDGNEDSRKDSIRVAVALNALSRLEQLVLSEEGEAIEENVAVGYDDLESMDNVEQALERAIAYRDRFDSTVLGGMRESLGNELVDTIKANGEFLKKQLASTRMSNREKVFAIESLAAEAQISYESLLSFRDAGNSEYNAVSEVTFAGSDSKSGGMLEIIDTLSFEDSVGSRFFLNENSAGVWSHVDSWYVLGPFHHDHKFVTNRDPMDRIAVDLDQRVSYRGNGSRSWEYRRMDSPTLAFGDADSELVYYLYSELYSEMEQSAVLWVRSTGSVKLWLNESEKPNLVTDQISRTSLFSYDRLSLKKGYNRLIVRVVSKGRKGYLWLAHSTVVATAVGE